MIPISKTQQKGKRNQKDHTTIKKSLNYKTKSTEALLFLFLYQKCPCMVQTGLNELFVVSLGLEIIEQHPLRGKGYSMGAKELPPLYSDPIS